jgi:hypothetical protein
MHTATIDLALPRKGGLIACAVAASLLFAACGSSDDDESAATTDVPASADVTTDDTTDDTTVDTVDEPAPSDDDGGTDTSPDDGVTASNAVDVGLFFDGALAEEVTTEDCTLSGGAETTCYRITVAGYPASHDTGPFCPSTITDEVGGLWWDGEAVYDLDGEFIADLAEIYGDDNWQMYDEDGNVFITETAEEFEAAARPDVDPSLQNHCVEGRLEWLDNGEPVTTTMLIPVAPVAADAAAAPQGNQGVTLDGVVIAASAPVDAILSAYTIAAFDDCGAHFNPVDGYHMHGAVGCSELDEVSDGETPMFGYALDGYAIHSPLDDPDAAELDECNGHTTEADGYHYHANSAEENQVVECLIGQTVAGAADAGGGGRPDGPPPGDG